MLPSTCLFCGGICLFSIPICSPCLKGLPILAHSCEQCAEYLHPSLLSNNKSRICGACLAYPPPFDHTFALFPYCFPIIEVITKLKFQHQLGYTKVLATLFIQRILQSWYKNKSLPDLILPIPLHDKRLQHRGFNQAYEIAKPIAKAFMIPVDFTGVKRIKNTQAQSRLSSIDRQTNVANAFVAKRSYTGMTIAVIDDVMTTGYTITEFCRVIRQSGAKNIDVWCCARNQKLG